MDTHVVNKSSVWGDHYKARNIEKIKKLWEKRAIIQGGNWPFIDHVTIYALNLKGQKGPAREAQTFIVSYPYQTNIESNDATGVIEIEFIQKLNDLQLKYYKKPTVFRGLNAFKILIMDTEVDLETVLRLLPKPDNE